MSQYILSIHARDIAFVTFSMLEALENYDEMTLPCGYRYALFGGCVPFCDHAAAAGLALLRACQDVVVDDWVKIVEDYAHHVIAYAVETGRPAACNKLSALAALAIGSTDDERGAP